MTVDPARTKIEREFVDPLAIKLDPELQSRDATDDRVVEEYASAMRDGAAFPAVVLYHDGTDYWCADGWHRVLAAREVDLEEIDAEIREGTRRDALRHSLGANTTHGLRRTSADKRRAVAIALADPEWAEGTDREIARLCGVSHTFVAQQRRPKSGNVATTPPGPAAPSALVIAEIVRCAAQCLTHGLRGETTTEQLRASVEKALATNLTAPEWEEAIEKGEADGLWTRFGAQIKIRAPRPATVTTNPPPGFDRLWAEWLDKLSNLLEREGGSASVSALRDSYRANDEHWALLVKKGVEAGRWHVETRGKSEWLILAGAPISAGGDPEPGGDREDEAQDPDEGPVLPDDQDDPAVQGHMAAGEEEADGWVDCDACGGSGLIDDLYDCDECGSNGGWYDTDADTDTDTDEEGADATPVTAAEAPYPKGTIGYAQDGIAKWLGLLGARSYAKRIEIDTIRSSYEREEGKLSDRAFAQAVRMGEGERWEASGAYIWLLDSDGDEGAQAAMKAASAPPSKPPKPRPSALPERLDPSLVDLRCESASHLLARLDDGEAALVIADPPWSYSQSHGASRADDHYPTLPLEDIAMHLRGAHRVGRRLALWITGALLGEWVAMKTPWGQPITAGAWVKSREGDEGHYGQGYHWAGSSELVLLYARDGSHTDRSSALRNAWIEERGEHSCKPIGWQTQWIRRWVPEGGLVVDLYAGLGSVAQATLLAGGGRRYVGCELDPARHAEALRRIEALVAREGA